MTSPIIDPIPPMMSGIREINDFAKSPRDLMSVFRIFGKLETSEDPKESTKANASFPAAWTNFGTCLTSILTASPRDLPNCSAKPFNPPLWNALSNLVISFVPNCTNVRSAGVRELETVIFAPSNADLNRVTSPARLSNCVDAISCAAPDAPSIAASSSLNLLPVVASKAFADFKSTLLKIVLRTSVFSPWVMPSIA